MTLVLCLIVLGIIIYIADVWELMGIMLAFHSTRRVRIHLGNWGVGDGGRLRCLHGKVDITITCTCIVGST